MTVQRLKTAKEAWFGVVRTLYMLFALPFLLFLGVVTLFMALSYSGSEKIETAQFSILMWSAALIPLTIFFYGMWSRLRLLSNITSSIRDADLFSPAEGLEYYQQREGKYLGIDTKNGTILYVHRIRKGEVDVVGLSVDDWTRREVEGNTLRLYTKFPDLPCIEISTPWAKLWYDTLGAMEHRRSGASQYFPQYVREQAEVLEQELQIHIPHLA
jgi:hypothetical protein